ncbi:MAG: hypothetical protein ABI334_00140 [Candidatus Dormiibacterota bacterium]
MEQAQPEAERLNRLAVVSLVAGLIGLAALHSFPIVLTWLGSGAVPVANVLVSATPLIASLLAIVLGHVVLIRSRVRGRRAAWAALAFGYLGLIAAASFEALFWLLVALHPIAY